MQVAACEKVCFNMRALFACVSTAILGKEEAKVVRNLRTKLISS